MKSLEWSQLFPHCKSIGIFPDAQGQLTPVRSPIWSKFELIPAFMAVLITCKNEDPIKNRGSRVLTRLYVDFSDTQGQLTPKSDVESG